MRTRSYENQMFICFTHPKVSLMTNPRGKVEAKLESNATDVLVHTIDLSLAHEGNHLENRRPDLYGPLADVDHRTAQKPFIAPSLDAPHPEDQQSDDTSH
jgi:hypothetical protein